MSIYPIQLSQIIKQTPSSVQNIIKQRSCLAPSWKIRCFSPFFKAIQNLFWKIITYLTNFFLGCSSPLSRLDLKQLEKEDFVEYSHRIKLLELSTTDKDACLRFIRDESLPLTPYLKCLQTIFTRQLIIKMGSGAFQVTKDFLEKKAKRLTQIFLKDKFSLRKSPLPEFRLAEKAQWDPHFHASSIFAEYFPKARLFLPNYEQAYPYLKPMHRALKDRAERIRMSMEDRSFAKVTEVSSSYDDWHFEHKGKKIIPILANLREQGGVKRRDVTGYDLCGMEKEGEYQPQKAFMESLPSSSVVRIHMGETIIASIGKRNMTLMLDEAENHYKSSKPLRIGHGTHTSIEDMIRIVQKGYYVEACLTSNKRTGILNKRSEYPLGIMLLLGVKVVIGTDGGSLYSTTLPEEYGYAIRNIKKFHLKLKTSDAPVQLPNGDRLCFKHILGIIQKDKQKEALKRSDDPLTYRELGAIIDPKILERISPDTLALNARELLKKCYPRL